MTGYRIAGVVVGIVVFIIGFWLVWSVLSFVPHANPLEEWPLSVLVGLIAVGLYMLMVELFRRRES